MRPAARATAAELKGFAALCVGRKAKGGSCHLLSGAAPELGRGGAVEAQGHRGGPGEGIEEFLGRPIGVAPLVPEELGSVVGLKDLTLALLNRDGLLG
jgi:hypothetical protein